MLRHVILAVLLLVGMATSAAAATPATIKDPEEWSQEAITKLLSGAAAGAAFVGDAVGKNGNDIVAGFSFFDKSGKLEYMDNVVDHTYGQSTRDIIYYLYLPDAISSMIFVRFIFRRTSTGWRLNWFHYADGGTNVFPKDWLVPTP